MSAADIIDEINAQEKRIRELRCNPRENYAELSEVSRSMRKNYRELLVKHPGFSTEKVKDLVSHLWKTCFYKPIEEFRSSIKQRKKALDAQKMTTGQYVQRDKDQLMMINQEFISFLKDSLRYFLKLMAELEDVAAQQLRDNHPAVHQQLVTSIYGCLLYLGDLARYKVLYSDDGDDYAESVRYYERAALIMPAAGNAQNQLAMLATYSEAESTAVFHYCRSVLAKSPFSGGLQNLARVLALNVETFRGLQRQYRGDANIRFKFVLSSFVRLHSLLFAWTISMQHEHLATHVAGVTPGDRSTLVTELHSTMANSVLRGNQSINADDFNELLDNLLKDLDLLIFNPKLSELHLLRLVAISIFFVHFTDSPERAASAAMTGHEPHSSFLSSLSSIDGSQAEADAGDALEASCRTKVQSLALSALFKLVARVASKFSEGVSSSDKNRRSSVQKLLPMLSTFADWAGHHSVYLTSSDPATLDSQAPHVTMQNFGVGGEDLVMPAVFGDLGVERPSMTQESWQAKYRADRDDLRSEARARSMMKAALGMMKEDLNKDLSLHAKGVEDILGSVKPGMILREHAELRGYLPVQQRCERLFGQFDPLQKTLVWVPESMARTHRMLNLLAFVRTLERGPTRLLDSDHPLLTPPQPTLSQPKKSDVLEGALKDKERERKERDLEKKEKKGKDKKGGDKKGPAIQAAAVATIAIPAVVDQDFPSLPSYVANPESTLSLNKLMYSEPADGQPIATASPGGEKAYGLWASFVDGELLHDVSMASSADWAPGLFGDSSALSGDAHGVVHEDYLEDLLDDEVVFKPAFPRPLSGRDDALSLGAPGLGALAVGAPTPPLQVPGLFPGDTKKSDADIWASLGMEGTGSTRALASLGLDTVSAGSSSLFSSDWSDSLLRSLGTSNATEWGASILTASVPHAPAVAATVPPPHAGETTAPPPGLVAPSSPVAPPGLRGPPKRAYLGSGGNWNT